MAQFGKLLVAALFLATLAGCSRSDGNKLIIIGSSTLAPVISEVAAAYEKREGVRVDVQSGGSGRGIVDVRAGLADIGMVSRALKPDEADLDSYTVALDGVAFIVNRDNPVAELTKEQIIALYKGQTRNWRQLGGPDLAITVVHKAAGRATQEVFLDYLDLTNDMVMPSMVIGENQEGVRVVAGNRGAIAYVSVGAAEYEAAHGAAIRLLPLAGVAASTEALREGRYPMHREVNLVTRGPATGIVKSFVEFANAPSARSFYDQYGFVPASR
ncbi:MAG: phosphate ABC transporter substrate-binding protein [Gammaproteobacteria bacterium]|nr:phosphate ABC transporter substrate-binding protein [Gammaproteobacteria bacterium]